MEWKNLFGENILRGGQEYVDSGAVHDVSEQNGIITGGYRIRRMSRQDKGRKRFCKKALSALQMIDKEMMHRYETFASLGVKDIETYNSMVNESDKLFRIVIVIDEYMEMMMEAPDELEDMVKRISRLARASGIHLVMATQRPSAKIITPEIKANIPCRASFTVVDWREYKTILDRTGAERLLGDGDMLYSSAESAVPTHAQAAFVSNQEVDRVIADVIDKNSRED